MLSISHQELSNLIGEIYEASLTSKWQQLLEKICDATASNKAILMQNFTRDCPPLLAISARVDYPENALTLYQERLPEDPYYLATVDGEVGTALICNDYVDIEQYRNTSYFQDVLVPMSTYHVMVSMLHRDGINDSVLILNRGEEAQAYTDSDKHLINLLVPHLQRAICTYKELEMYKYFTDLSECLFKQTGKGLLICDNEGFVNMINPCAEEIIDNREDVYIDNGRLKLVCKNLQNKIIDYIALQSKFDFETPMKKEAIILGEHTVYDETCLLVISPLKSQGKMKSSYLITVTTRQSLNWNLVSKSYSLTPKESQLLTAIYNDYKLHELTDMLNASYNTLRTHLQSIFRKFNVHSQQELLVKLNMFT